MFICCVMSAVCLEIVVASQREMVHKERGFKVGLGGGCESRGLMIEHHITYKMRDRGVVNGLRNIFLKNKQNQLPTRSWAPRRLESHTGVPKAARNVVPGAHGTSVWAPEAAPQVCPWSIPFSLK
ncbi:hypothetical protein MtrunA17_Chr2g0319781 [Medicago truncatula]|uniref:Transmembrane protein n=1 Tax=Medicago truncatula TaxID=3880 RepID=A0A396JAX3_MEDTR|nr:hypothetical protein MtrunA17_Chr2g0319781 [Medicago truncatula]